MSAQRKDFMQRKANVTPAAQEYTAWRLLWRGISGQLGESDVEEVGWLGSGAH